MSEPRLHICSTWSCTGCTKTFRRYPGCTTPITCPECAAPMIATCDVAEAKLARLKGARVWPERISLFDDFPKVI